MAVFDKKLRQAWRRRVVIGPYALTAALAASALPAAASEPSFVLRGLYAGMRADELPRQVDSELLPSLRLGYEAVVDIEIARLGDDECPFLYDEGGFACLMLMAVLTHEDAPVSPQRIALLRMEQNYEGPVREADFEARLFAHYGQPDHIQRGTALRAGGTRRTGYLWMGDNQVEFHEQYAVWLETGDAMTRDSRPDFEKPYLHVVAGLEDDLVIGIVAVSIHPGYTRMNKDILTRQTELRLEQRRERAAGEVRF